MFTTRSQSILKASLLAAVALVGGAGVAQVGCSGPGATEGVAGSPAGSSPAESASAGSTTGTVGFSLTLPGGALIGSVSYDLLTSAGSAVTLSGQANPGTVPVQNSQSIDFQLGGVPAAAGDSITLTATTSAGGTCQGSAGGLNIAAGSTQTVQVAMICTLPGADAGNLYVTGTTSYCGTWTSLSTAGSEVYVGESVILTATATGFDPSNLGYTWTMSNPIGVFGAIYDGGVGTQGQDEAVGPSDPMQFMCTSPGTTVITLVVDDGPLPADSGTCPTNLTTTQTTVVCDAYPANQVESAWVEIGQGAGDAGNVAIARALTAYVAPDGGSNPCPNITLNGSGGTSQQMNLRAAATTSLPLRSTIVAGKPSFFPVSSCELALPAGTTSAVVAGQSLPLPKANPQTVVVIGDTGCRLETGNGFQPCNDPTQYPFATIAGYAAAVRPDLVLHVGDYQYRETECPAGMSSASGCGGSPWGYGWDTWEADLFVPGAPLLAAAPWIMVRGNHEMCNRAGQGWYRFLDTNPYDPNVKNCNSAANDAIAAGGNYNNPFLVAINAATQLIVFDSSNGPKTVQSPTSVAYTTYQSELQAAGALVANPPAGVLFNWWANHHPILGYATATPPALPTTTLPGLAPIFDAVFPNTYFPPNVNLALHGHTHDFQAIDFAPGVASDGGTYSNPATIVSGNAGDLLDVALPWPINGADPGVTVATEGDAGVGSAMANSAAFGYMVMVYQPASSTWAVTEYNQSNGVRDTCTLQTNGQLTCASWGYLP
jgi:hypothetical protein